MQFAEVCSVAYSGGRRDNVGSWSNHTLLGRSIGSQRGRCADRQNRDTEGDALVWTFRAPLNYRWTAASRCVYMAESVKARNACWSQICNWNQYRLCRNTRFVVWGFCFCFTLVARSQNYFSFYILFFFFSFFLLRLFWSSAVSIVGGGGWGGCMGRGYGDGIICIGKSLLYFRLLSLTFLVRDLVHDNFWGRFLKRKPATSVWRHQPTHLLQSYFRDQTEPSTVVHSLKYIPLPEYGVTEAYNYIPK